MILKMFFIGRFSALKINLVHIFFDTFFKISVAFVKLEAITKGFRFIFLKAIILSKLITLFLKFDTVEITFTIFYFFALYSNANFLTSLETFLGKYLLNILLNSWSGVCSLLLIKISPKAYFFWFTEYLVKILIIFSNRTYYLSILNNWDRLSFLISDILL